MGAVKGATGLEPPPDSSKPPKNFSSRIYGVAYTYTKALFLAPSTEKFWLGAWAETMIQLSNFLLCFKIY